MPRHNLLCLSVLLALTSLHLTAAPQASADELHPIAADVAKQLDDANKPFVLLVNFTTQEDKADAFISAMREPIAETAKEEGNIAYELNQTSNEPTKFVLYEHWKSLAALDAHLKQPYLTKLLGAVEGIMAEPPELTVCVPVAGAK